VTVSETGSISCWQKGEMVGYYDSIIKEYDSLMTMSYCTRSFYNEGLHIPPSCIVLSFLGFAVFHGTQVFLALCNLYKQYFGFPNPLSWASLKWYDFVEMRISCIKIGSVWVLRYTVLWIHIPRKTVSTCFYVDRSQNADDWLTFFIHLWICFANDYFLLHVL
jgi:hypothetical protein